MRLNRDNNTDVGITPLSEGKFTVILKDINESYAPNGFPQQWTRYEIIITGMPEPKKVKIGFRYFPDPSTSNVIGIDLFEFKSI